MCAPLFLSTPESSEQIPFLFPTWLWLYSSLYVVEAKCLWFSPFHIWGKIRSSVWLAFAGAVRVLWGLGRPQATWDLAGGAVRQPAWWAQGCPGRSESQWRWPVTGCMVLFSTENSKAELGPCGWILVAFSLLLVVITFPLSIWICIKVKRISFSSGAG